MAKVPNKDVLSSLRMDTSMVPSWSALPPTLPNILPFLIEVLKQHVLFLLRCDFLELIYM